MVEPAAPEQILSHAQWVFELARRLVGESGAGDVAQQTMLAAMRRPPVADRPLQPWLSRVVRGFAAKWGRAAERRRRHEDRAAQLRPVEAPSPAELLASAEVLAQLVQAVSELPPPLRDAVSLCHMQGLTSAQAGQRLGVPAGTVRWRIAEALVRLRAALDAHHGGDRRSWVGIMVAAVGRSPVPAATTRGLLFAVALALATVSMVLVAVAWWPLAAVGPVVAPAPSATAAATTAALPAAAAGAGLPASRDRIVAAVSEQASALPDLAPGAAGILARIVAADGRPAAGMLEWTAGTDAFAYAGEDGFVRLSVRPFADRSTLTLACDAPGSAVVAVRVRVQVGHWTDLGEVVVTPVSGVAGTVVDENGAPVADAVVFCGPAADPDERERVLGPATEPDFVVDPVRTTADGSFRLARVPARPLRVWAVAPMRAFVASAQLHPDAGRDLVVEPLMCRPLSVSGLAAVTVVDESGCVVRARVRVRRSGMPADPAGVLGPRWFAVGDDGRAVLPLRGGPPAEILVEADGFEPQQLELACGAVAVAVLTRAR